MGPAFYNKISVFYVEDNYPESFYVVITVKFATPMFINKIQNTAFVLAVTVYVAHSKLSQNGIVHPVFGVHFRKWQRVVHPSGCFLSPFYFSVLPCSGADQ